MGGRTWFPQPEHSFTPKLPTNKTTTKRMTINIEPHTILPRADEERLCSHSSMISRPKYFRVDDLGDTQPYLYIEHGVVTVCFDNWHDLTTLRDTLNDAIEAHQLAELNRAAALAAMEAEVIEPNDLMDDTASRDGDRNHELTEAMGGPTL